MSHITKQPFYIITNDALLPSFLSQTNIDGENISKGCGCVTSENEYCCTGEFCNANDDQRAIIRGTVLHNFILVLTLKEKEFLYV